MFWDAHPTGPESWIGHDGFWLLHEIIFFLLWTIVRSLMDGLVSLCTTPFVAPYCLTFFNQMSESFNLGVAGMKACMKKSMAISWVALVSPDWLPSPKNSKSICNRGSQLLRAINTAANEWSSKGEQLRSLNAS